MNELPSGWASATLPDLVGAEGLFSDGDWVESKDQDPAGDVRLTQLADVGDGVFRDRSSRFMTRVAAARLGCKYLASGDVLVARMPDPLGRACIYPGGAHPAVTAVDVCIIRPGRSSVDARWLMWWLNTPHVRTEVEARQLGTTRKRISRKNLASIILPVPPLAEQRQIVAAIEEQLSRLDAATDALKHASSRLAVLRTHGIEAALAGEWPRVRLGEIADIVGGVTKDTQRQQDPAFVEVPYLRVANVQRGFLDLTDVATIRVRPEKAAALELQPGDVLFNEGGDRDKLGRGWVWLGEIKQCIHQNHVFRARLHEGFEPKFVSWHGNTFGRKWFETHGRQTTNLASLNLTTLRAFPVPAPPLEEQRRILNEIEHSVAASDRLAAQVRAALARSSGLRRSILAQAFRGELVPQDPNDEPAKVLLERIAAERAAAPKPARRPLRGAATGAT
jgi:type I restriction enzyme S subunit